MCKITIHKKLDTSLYPWCDSAVIFSVKGGKSALRLVGSDYDDNYEYDLQLMLNGYPLTQAELPICQTCCGTLAAGYGIENVDCKELSELRDKLNDGYNDILTSAKLLEPLLGLLDDGLYVLADIPHYPTDGDGRFFYNIPNESRDFDALRSSYYFGEFMTLTESFPKYLYPTQSDTLLNNEHIEYYMNILRSSKTPPRAIAYHQHGFISALIDGHHKATAAARLGMPISCLTIIGSSFCSEYHYLTNTKHESVLFSALKVNAEDVECYDEFRSAVEHQDHTTAKAELYQLVSSTQIPDGFCSDAYPTVRELAGLYAAGLENAQPTDQLIAKLQNSSDSEDMARLKYLLLNLKYSDKAKATELARRIFGNSNILFNDTP